MCNKLRIGPHYQQRNSPPGPQAREALVCWPKLLQPGTSVFIFPACVVELPSPLRMETAGQPKVGKRRVGDDDDFVPGAMIRAASPETRHPRIRGLFVQHRKSLRGPGSAKVTCPDRYGRVPVKVSVSASFDDDSGKIRPYPSQCAVIGAGASTDIPQRPCADRSRNFRVK